MPEFSIDQIDKIKSECQKLLLTLQKVDQKNFLDQWSASNQDQKFEHIWSSNAIEGSHINSTDVYEILDEGFTGYGGNRVYDVLCTLDLSRAYDKMLLAAENKTPITEHLIKELHCDLTQFSDPDISGQYRTTEVYPTQNDSEPYSQPSEIYHQMDDLFKWIPIAQAKLHPITFAARLHLKIFLIQPFEDGNNVLARLLMNMALIEKGYPLVNFSPYPDDRDVYYDC